MFTQLLFLCIALPTLASSQQATEQTISWKQGQRLTWADYLGQPDPSSDAAASTTTYLGIEYHLQNNNFSYTITSSFSKTRSWGLHKNAHILAHEQGHFDIAEIYARKLNKLMSEYRFNKSSFKSDLASIYQGVLQEKEAMQNRYDGETNHSINKEQQAEWEQKIAADLERFRSYAGY